MTYTYDDILCVRDILTGSVRTEDIAGRDGWFTDVAGNLRRAIDEDDLNILASGTMDHIDNVNVRFVTSEGVKWDYFIPKKKPSYEERQAEWIKENNIKIGDKVRILRTFSSGEDGCSVPINPEGKMDCLVGTIGEISGISSGSIGVHDDKRNHSWRWPYFVLEKVEDEPDNAKPQFKVGDKVRIVKEWGGFTEGSKPTIGETGVIEEAGDAYIKVRLDSDNDWWLYSYDAVELIKDESAYIPFDLSDPKDRDFLRGKWVKTKQTESESLISSFKYTKGYGWRAHIPSIGFTTGEDLLEELTFLDSSVIGKPANGQQMK